MVFALLPFLLGLLLAGPERSSYAAEVGTVEHLADTQEGELQFFLVSAVAGRSPADRFVITLDRNYSAGMPAAVTPGDALSVEGTLMDKETYFGDQYLFFGYPQLYVSQVKTGLFWPSQISAMRTLYLAPASSVVALYAIFALTFMEEFTIAGWLVALGGAVLVVAALVLIVLWRRRPVRIVLLVAGYMLAAVLLAIPGVLG